VQVCKEKDSLQPPLNSFPELGQISQWTVPFDVAQPTTSGLPHHSIALLSSSSATHSNLTRGTRQECLRTTYNKMAHSPTQLALDVHSLQQRDGGTLCQGSIGGVNSKLTR